LFPDRPTTSPWLGDKLLEVTLNDHERRVVGRVLTERKALLIETTGDTIQPDAARRAGLIELSIIGSILGKLRTRPSASLLREGIETILAGDVNTGKARFCATIKATRRACSGRR
jgi:hypothetical protein